MCKKRGRDERIDDTKSIRYSKQREKNVKTLGLLAVLQAVTLYYSGL
jgi:hypothetical protein